MAKQSAGILVYRRRNESVEVLLGHPGGPFWAKKDVGAWSVPKGEVEDDEDLLAAAKREFSEETGKPVPEGEFLELGSFKRSGGKLIHAWAVEGDLDTGSIVSNTLQVEWPPKSGQQIEIPEIDRASWVPLTEAPAKLHKGQDVFIERLAEKLGVDMQEPPEAPVQQTLL
jgi:predicted NUDIX family NTP pyrophosphohydrolase